MFFSISSVIFLSSDCGKDSQSSPFFVLAAHLFQCALFDRFIYIFIFVLTRDALWMWRTTDRQTTKSKPVVSFVQCTAHIHSLHMHLTPHVKNNEWESKEQKQTKTNKYIFNGCIIIYNTNDQNIQLNWCWCATIWRNQQTEQHSMRMGNVARHQQQQCREYVVCMAVCCATQNLCNTTNELHYILYEPWRQSEIAREIQHQFASNSRARNAFCEWSVSVYAVSVWIGGHSRKRTERERTQRNLTPS